MKNSEMNTDRIHPTPTIPNVPKDWDRCHAYNHQKKRFCRQTISPNLPSANHPRPIYCGNHSHFYSQSTNVTTTPIETNHTIPLTTTLEAVATETSNPTLQRNPKRCCLDSRIPCPLDPTHTIYSHQLQRHIRKCPSVTQQQQQERQGYFRKNVNAGGYGPIREDTTHHDSTTREEGKDTVMMDRKRIQARNVAMRALALFHELFLFCEDCPDHSHSRWNCIPHSHSNTDLSHGTWDHVQSPSSSTNFSSCSSWNDCYKNITLEQIQNPKHIHLEDDSKNEEYDRGLIQSLQYHRIKLGGDKHFQQIKSILHHVRQCSCSCTCQTSPVQVDTILELGTGRGTTGFVVASALAAHSSSMSLLPKNDMNQDRTVVMKSPTMNLLMVDKGGSRAKADTAIRRSMDSIHQEEQDEQHHLRQEAWRYLNVHDVAVTRIKCDLAHVHIPSVIKTVPTNIHEYKSSNMEIFNTTSTDRKGNARKRHIVVIAKHLCGAGTDIALKSIASAGIQDRIRCCVFATCCHGLCTWADYVGRPYLSKLFLRKSFDSDKIVSFGEDEFKLLTRWSSGTVSNTCCPCSDDNPIGLHATNEKISCSPSTAYVKKTAWYEDSFHHRSSADDNTDGFSVTNICRDLDLKCGTQGLGRVCQRLIDYGRLQFMKEHIFENVENSKVSICHYIDCTVTPQNAMLKGWWMDCDE